MANILEVFINGDAKGLNKSLSSAQSKLKAFGKQTTEIGKRLSTRLTLPIGLAGAAAVKSASDFERLKTSLGVLTGSAENGAKAFERLVKFSAQTPFQLSDLAAVNNQLIGFGMSADQAFESLKLLGDVSAVAGADLSRVAVAFGQSAAAGRVMTQDLNQFVNNGIPIFQLLGDITGKNAGQLREMSGEGKITFELLNKAFKNATDAGGRFENGMQKLSQTFAGQFSTLKDNLNIALAEFGKILLPILKNVLSSLTKLIQRFASLSPRLKEGILRFSALAAILPPLLVVIGSVATAIGAISAPVAIAVAAISGLIIFFDDIVSAGERLRDFLQDKLNVFLIKAKEKFELLGNEVNRFGSILREIVTKRFSADIDSINKKFDEQSETIKKLAKDELALLTVKKKDEKQTKKTKDVNDENVKSQNKTIETARKLVKTVSAFTLVRKKGDREFIKGTKILSQFEYGTDRVSGAVKLATDGLKKMNIVIPKMKVQTKGLSEGVEQLSMMVGDTLIGAFEGLMNGENFFKSVIRGLISLTKKLAAAAAAAAVLAFLLPGGKGKLLQATDFAGKFKEIFAGFTGLAFANGGVISGPTLGLMGEYPGARSNPEVVAPLDKLKSMIGGGQTNVTVSGGFRLDGQDLVLALERANRNNKRFA